MAAIRARAAARRRIEDAANDADADFGWPPPNKQRDDELAIDLDPLPGETLGAYSARLEQRRKDRR
jgi:hypothetical protein